MFIMKPLEPFRDKLIITTGLWSQSSEPPEGTTGSDHRVAAAFLAGSKPKKTAGADVNVGSATIDQTIAAKIGPMMVVEGTASAKIGGPAAVSKGELCYAVDRGAWQSREWKTVPAIVTRDTVQAKVPYARPLVLYLNITDSRGMLVSSPHVTLLK